MIAEATQLRLAATLAIVGFVWWVMTTVALQILAAGANDPVEQSISELALGRFGAFMDVAFFAFGIGSLALAFGLYRSVRGALIAPLLLAAAGVLWFLLGVFQTGLGGSVIHGAVASAPFLLIVVIMFLFAQRFRVDERWRPFALPTLVWAIGAAWTLFSIPLLGDEIFGLLERAFVAVFVSWLLVTAIRLRFASM